MYLSDVPTAPDVNSALLAPPPISSVTDLALQPPVGFTVKLPSTEKPTLSTGEIAAITGAVLLALWGMGKRR